MKYLHIDLSNYISFFSGLFALINPIGMIPIFIGMTSYQTQKDRNKTNLITNISAAIILIISLFIGHFILQFFGISINSFRIAGGILIINIAMSMIHGTLINQLIKKKTKNKSSYNIESISVIPLAMPLISGPGAISSTIIWSTNHYNLKNMIGCSIVIIFFFTFCYTLFKISPYIIKLFKPSGINILTKIMGLLLMSLGIELIISSFKIILLELLQ